MALAAKGGDFELGDGRGGEAWDWMGWVFLFLSRQLFDSSCGESMSKDFLFIDVLHGLYGLDEMDLEDLL